jgi:anti-sigma factor RsiW
MMTCRELIDFLMDYVSGEVSPDERARFDEHLAVCPHCRAYLQNYRETVIATKAAHEPTKLDSPQMPPELVKAILSARKKDS